MRLFLSVAAILVIACIALAALFALSAPPSTRDLDADLARVREQIIKAQADRALYEGGLVTNLVDVRIEILRANESFLQMKRDSLLRRIDLRYTIEGQAVTTKPEHIAALERDIAATTARVAESKAKAARYTGGLVQTLALVEAATYDVTLAQLNLSLMAEQHGLLIQIPKSVGESAPSAPLGQTVVSQDGDAL